MSYNLYYRAGTNREWIFGTTDSGPHANEAWPFKHGLRVYPTLLDSKDYSDAIHTRAGVGVKEKGFVLTRGHLDEAVQAGNFHKVTDGYEYGHHAPALFAEVPGGKVDLLTLTRIRIDNREPKYYVELTRFLRVTDNGRETLAAQKILVDAVFRNKDAARKDYDRARTMLCTETPTATFADANVLGLDIDTALDAYDAKLATTPEVAREVKKVDPALDRKAFAERMRQKRLQGKAS